MKTDFILLILIFSSINTFALLPSDFNWELQKERQGIKIYTAPKHDSGVVPIKAQTILEHSMPKILSVIADTNRKMEWVPSLTKSYVIEVKSKYSRVEYSLYNAPWPFDDREFVIATSGNYNEKENTIFIDIKSIQHEEAPLNSDNVRGKTHIGSVFMRGIGPNKTFFEITLLTEFKGNIPTWIINLVQKKWPFKMFKNIKKQLEKDIKVLPEFQDYNP